MTLTKITWYRSPLAILLCVLLAGHLPVVPELRTVPQASAQGLCLPTNPPIGQSAILQYCSADQNLERLAVQDWLARNEIPAQEASWIYQYGRLALRSQIRAHMFTTLIAIITKPKSDRNAEEAAIYDWFQNLVWAREKSLYEAAIADRNRWQADKCRWRPDAQVAEAHGLSYDGSVYCGVSGDLSVLFSIAPPMPSRDYFLGAALKNTYGQRVGNTTGGTKALEEMGHDLESSAALAVASAVALAGFYASTIGGYLLAGGAMYAGKTLIVAGIKGAAISGPIAIVAVAIIIGAIATYQVAMNEENLKRLAALDADLQRLQSNKPDLEGFARDNVGLYKLMLVYTEATLPDFPSSNPLPTGSGRPFVITPEGGAPQTHATFTYSDWFGVRYTAKAVGGWLTHNGVAPGGHSVTELSPAFRFRDWSGKRYTASRVGFRFIVAKNEAADTDRVCESGSNGLPLAADLSACSAYSTTALKLKDGDGNNITLAVAGTPEFTSTSSGTFAAGSASSFEITAIGQPAPSISLLSPLPAGFSFQGSEVLGAGRARVSYSGSGTPAGVYPLILSASNGLESAQQYFTATLSTPVQILTPTDVTFMAGVPFTHTVTVAGSPRPALNCIAGNLSSSGQVTFSDNGDGTITFRGTLSGRPLDGSLHFPPSCTLTASNGITSDSKSAVFRDSPSPAASITSPTTALFASRSTAGTPTGVNELPISTTGAITPVSFIFPCGDKPSWLNVTRTGPDSGLLTGNPPTQPATYNFTLQAYAAGSLPPTPQCSSPNYSIQARVRPVFPDPLHAILSTDFEMSFLGTGTLPGITTSLAGELPPNVTFQPGSFGNFGLSGQPPVGSGGEYRPLLTMTSPIETMTREMRLVVLERPRVTSPDMAIFPLGLNTRFQVTASGFPRASVEGIPGLTSKAMRFSLSGTLPAGLTFRDTDGIGAGLPVGTGVISGIPQPGTTGAYPLTITVDNGVAPAATQVFTLLVTRAGDVNNDTRIDCVDVSLVRAAFGAWRGTPRYDVRADINSDGVIDVRDVSLVSSRLPAGTRCQ